MSEYIRTNKFDTNECPNKFVTEKLIWMNVRIYIRDQYIRIFEYSNIFVTLCDRCNLEASYSCHLIWGGDKAEGLGDACLDLFLDLCLCRELWDSGWSKKSTYSQLFVNPLEWRLWDWFKVGIQSDQWPWVSVANLQLGRKASHCQIKLKKQSNKHLHL